MHKPKLISVTAYTPDGQAVVIVTKANNHVVSITFSDEESEVTKRGGEIEKMTRDGNNRHSRGAVTIDTLIARLSLTFEPPAAR